MTRLEKSPTGIAGFDEVTNGGVPKGRPTIVCGGPGCGKTMFAAEFLVRGATEFNEPGVLMTFEETSEEMSKNVASLGFDLKKLTAKKKMVLEYVRIEPAEIQETGEYDLEGLFIRLQHAVKAVGAKRVVLDTVEAIFSGFSNTGMLRAEIRRLFRWLKDHGLTTVVTAEKGEGSLTRYGLEEYVSDCVIFLDHRVTDQISTRRMRVVKYRGASHVADEIPFLIDERGFSVMLSSLMKLDHAVSNERISSGVKDLDDMLEGRGFTGDRRCWFRERRARESRAWRRTLRRRPAGMGNDVCTWHWKSLRRRRCATCDRSDSIWRSRYGRDCCDSKRGDRRRAG